jgi:hypothetical protein
LEFLAYVDDVRPYIKKMMVNNTFDYQRAMRVIGDSNQQKEKEKELVSNPSKELLYDYTSPMRSPSLTASKWNTNNYLTPDVTSPVNKSINIKIINNNNNHYIITPQDSYMNPNPQETKSFYNTFRKSYLTEDTGIKTNNYTGTNNNKLKTTNSLMSSYLNDEPRYNFQKPSDKPSYLTQKYNTKTVSIPDKKPSEPKMLTRTSIQSNFRNYSSPKGLRDTTERPSTSMKDRQFSRGSDSYMKDTMQRVPSTHSLMKSGNDRSYFGYKDTTPLSPMTRPLTASSSVQKFNSTTVYRSNNYDRDENLRGFSQSSRSNSKINSVQRDLRNNFTRPSTNYSKIIFNSFR